MHFTAALTLLVIALGLIYWIDILVWAPTRRRQLQAIPLSLQFVRTLWPLLVIILLLRTFLFEPFRIPSESLKPTLAMGDIIAVNKHIYGLRDPLTDTKFIDVSEPKVGDIIVFRWPVDPAIYFIKRVIGLPGDTIDYVDKQLTINGKVIKQTTIGGAIQEDLLGVTHGILLNKAKPAMIIHHLVVPQGYYFVLGDNRDDSCDSRYWGFVPETAIVGKATRVLLSIGSQEGIQWRRWGQKIQ